MNPRPRHSKCGRSANTSAITSRAFRLPSHGHDPRVLVLHLAAAGGELAQDHLDRLEDVERLEAGDHHRLAVVGGDELERPRADHRRHVPRPHEAVEAQVGRLQQRPQRRHDQHVVAHAREVAQALRLRALQRERGGGGRRLEADREEHHLAVRVLAGDAQGVERRVDHPHVGALGLRLEQRPVGPGDAHHVAEAGEDHARLAGDRDAVVHPPHGDDADGTPRAVHQLDVGGQQVVDPVLVDGVRVPAAHLHHLVVAARLDGAEDLARERAAELRVTELLDEPHAGAPARPSRAIATPAWTRSASPGATVAHQRDIDLAGHPVGVRALRQPVGAPSRPP